MIDLVTICGSQHFTTLLSFENNAISLMKIHLYGGLFVLAYKAEVKCASGLLGNSVKVNTN